jgi:hypothetical protein
VLGCNLMAAQLATVFDFVSHFCLPVPLPQVDRVPFPLQSSRSL